MNKKIYQKLSRKEKVQLWLCQHEMFTLFVFVGISLSVALLAIYAVTE